MAKIKNPVYASAFPDGTWRMDGSWDECLNAMSGQKGVKYKKFASRSDAAVWLSENGADIPEEMLDGRPALPSEPYAFVDGCYNKNTGSYGFGGFLAAGGRKYPLFGAGFDPERAKMQNVAGEMDGCMAAVRMAEELGIDKLTICYDYMGIEHFADGSWRASSPGTAEYADFMQSPERSVEITFQKVPAHMGMPENEAADAMAKRAAGIKLSPKQEELWEKVLSSARRDGIPGSCPEPEDRSDEEECTT